MVLLVKVNQFPRRVLGKFINIDEEAIMPKQIKAGLRPEVLVEDMAVNMIVKDGDEVLAEELFTWEALPADIQARIQLHGLSTLLQQRTSDIKQDPEATVDAMIEVYNRLVENEWAKERKIGTRVIPAIVEVLAELKNSDTGSIQKAYNKLSDEQKAELRKKYAEDIERVEARRRSTEVDLEDLL